MDNTFKVNDIILHKNLGLMILVEEYPKEVNTDSIGYKLHGTPLFKMIKLLGTDENQWILYNSSLHAVRLATDENIIEGLTHHICTIDLDESNQLSFNPESETISMSSYYLDGEYSDGIVLEKNTIKLLKKYLKELNV